MRGIAAAGLAASWAAIAASILALASCSSVETTGAGARLAARPPSEYFQLKVSTGDDHMDAVVYETAYQQFSSVTPLREAPPFAGSLEITFASASQSNFQASPTKVAKGHARADRWYVGGRTVSATPGAGPFLEWQNSTMVAVLKRNDGEQLWTAAYSYKGGYELSGFVVNTPEKAARLVAKRLAARFIADSKK
jgi:hypothetical protein